MKGICFLKFVLAYIHDVGGSYWQFWLDLYCTLVSLPPLSLPLSCLPTPLKATARGFLVLFHIGIWSPSSTIYCHLNLLSSPSSLPLIPSLHTLAYFTVLVFVINIWVDVQRVVSVYALCGCACTHLFSTCVAVMNYMNYLKINNKF
jgi:hypothetical protein